MTMLHTSLSIEDMLFGGHYTHFCYIQALSRTAGFSSMALKDVSNNAHLKSPLVLDPHSVRIISATMSNCDNSPLATMAT